MNDKTKKKDRIRMIYRAFALYHRRGWVWISGRTVFKNRWIKESELNAKKMESVFNNGV